MRRLITALIVHTVFISAAIIETPNILKFSAPGNKTADIPNIKINDTVYGAIRHHWTDQAVGGFLVAFGKRLQLKISDDDHVKTFESCSKDTKDIGQYAECMTVLTNAPSGEQTAQNTKVVGSFRQSFSRVKRKTLKEAQMDTLNEDNVRVQNQSKPSISRFLTKLFLPIARPNRTVAQSYMDSVRQQSGLGNVNIEESNDEQADSNSDSFESLFSEDFLKIPYSFQFAQPIDQLESILDEFLTVHKEFDQTNGTIIAQDILHKFTDVIRETSRLGVTDPNDDNVKSILSPNLFSITEDTQPVKDKFLSPTLLSFHNDSNSILSIPQLLQSNGLSEDHQVWMDFVMDASGSTDILKGVKQLSKQLKQRSKRRVRTARKTSFYQSLPKLNNTRAQMLQNHTEVGKLLKNLQKNLTKSQLALMKADGYAFLDAKQIEFLYGPDSEERREILQFDVDNFLDMSVESKELLILKHIQDFVESRQNETRKKRAPIILTPVVLRALRGVRLNSPVVLSPILLSESTLAPSVLGPIILSPILFYAIILSPRLMSPIVLSPIAFLPVILTPVVLGPRILSPVILFPVVICPFVLSPIIVAPGALAAVIISPRVLTPYILSPLDTVGVLISPRVLSPLVKTKVTNAIVILSPNVLSRRKRHFRRNRFWRNRMANVATKRVGFRNNNNNNYLLQ